MLKTILIALILCVIEILVIVIASPMAKPAIVLRFLPEDVRLAAANHPEPPKGKQMMAHLLLAIFLIAMLGGMIYLGIDGLKGGYDFWQMTLGFIVFFYVMKAFDIIVQDQWLVITIGYKNQIIRIVSYPFLCMMIAGFFMLFR